jgi:hypothetical protein
MVLVCGFANKANIMELAFQTEAEGENLPRQPFDVQAQQGIPHDLQRRRRMQPNSDESTWRNPNIHRSV